MNLQEQLAQGYDRDDKPITISRRLRPNAAKMYQVGDVVRLTASGPQYTIVEKKGETVYLAKVVKGTKVKKAETPKPILLQRPAVAGRRRIRLEDE